MDKSRAVLCGLTLMCFAFGAAKAVGIRGGSEFNVIQRLTNALFENYARDVRPVADHKKDVNVSMGVALIQVDIDDVLSELNADVWLRFMWIDERFKWNPADYEGLGVLRVPSENIWRPDILLYNGARSGQTGELEMTNALIHEDGKVLWVPPVSYDATCELDFRRWPRDTQTCGLKFGSWTHHGNQISFSFYNGSSQVDLENLVKGNSKWRVVSTNASIVNKTYDCCQEPYPYIYFELTLKRESSFYIATIIIPAIVVVALTLASFIIPPNRGAKLAFGLTNVLILIAYMFNFSTQLPAMGGNIPVIVTFYQDTLLLVALSLVTSAILLWWTTSPGATGPPQILIKFLTGPVGNWLGLSSIITILSSNRSTLLRKFEAETPNFAVGDNEKGRDESEEPDFGPVIKKISNEEAQLQWMLLACAIDRVLMLLYTVLLGTLMVTCF